MTQFMHQFVWCSIISEEIRDSFFGGASSAVHMCCVWTSRCKWSPGPSVMWDCAVRSLNATFVVVPFLISSAHISPRGCVQPARIFSSELHFLSIVSALLLLWGQLGGKPHSSPALRCPWQCHVITGSSYSSPRDVKARSLTRQCCHAIRYFVHYMYVLLKGACRFECMKLNKPNKQVIFVSMVE